MIVKHTAKNGVILSMAVSSMVKLSLSLLVVVTSQDMSAPAIPVGPDATTSSSSSDEESEDSEQSDVPSETNSLIEFTTSSISGENDGRGTITDAMEDMQQLLGDDEVYFGMDNYNPCIGHLGCPLEASENSLCRVHQKYDELFPVS